MRDPREKHLTPGPLLALILLLSMAVAPHAYNLSPWITGFYFILALLRLISVHQPRALPGRLLLFLLSIGGVFNVLMHQTSPLGKDTAVALLTVMLGLKLMELKTQRDIYITVLLGFFIIITQFLYGRSMALAGYLGLAIIGLTAVLVSINQAQPVRNPLLPLRKALILLAQAIPVMVIMFLLFPRLSGPLWNLGLNENQGITGLSDSITPGSISKLSKSKAVAFRVHFEGEAPPTAKRYWRGPVLWDTDGRTWNTTEFSHPWAPTYFPQGEAISYEVTLEATKQRWLFALDLPVDLPENATALPDFQILSDQPISRLKRYKQHSHIQYNTGELHPEERQKGLALPANITPRMQRLVRGWQAQSNSPREVVNTALRHFNQEEFIYTLTPPLLIHNPADEFLFETRRGFCEHFATSFTLLMRLAGIPTRIVAGYQGGELNPHGDYYIVRQSDAHAWTEVWLEGQGWTRIDPTAAVAPERIEQPIDSDFLEDGAPVRFQLVDPGPLGGLLKQLSWGLDAVNTSWHRWILGYSDSRQNQMLLMLGLDFLKGKALGVGMVIFTGIAVVLITIGILFNSRTTTEPIVKLYQTFCKRLAKRGLARRPHEGPRDYADRIQHQRPDLRGAVEAIIRLYIGIRYGRLSQPAHRKQLRKLIREFHP